MKTSYYVAIVVVVAIVALETVWVFSQPVARVNPTFDRYQRDDASVDYGFVKHFGRLNFKEGNEELERLFQKYGPERNSWKHEEWFIRDFFEDRRGGVFVDVGAYKHKGGNNTYWLETERDWSGIAIDALEELRAGYEEHRPKTKFFAYFVSDKSSPAAQFHVHPNKGMSSGTSGWVEANAAEKREVPEITLNELLSREGIEKVDFLNMDIEGGEAKALQGFDIDRFRPDLVCIEMSKAKTLLAFFQEHGYERLELWSKIDSANDYFVPSEKQK